MKTEILARPEIKLIGLKVRTNNQNESQFSTAKIAPLVARYKTENIAARLPHRRHPGVALVGYSNYSSDEYGDYDFLFGEEVASLEEIPQGLSGLVIPGGKYLKVTSEAGVMPDIIMKTWQQVWDLTKSKTLGGDRLYHTDYEIYGQSAADPHHAVFEIYLGIR